MNFKKLILLFTVGLLLIAILISAYYFFAFSGGVAGWLDSLKQAPDLNSEEIIKMKDRTKDEIASLHEDIANQMKFSVHGETFQDQCVEGDHNWMRNDPYAFICTYQVTKFYSFDTDFRQTMLDLESVIRNEGWLGVTQNDTTPLTGMIREYYDNSENMLYGKTGLVSSLPSVTFYKKNSAARVTLRYAQRETLNIDQMESSLLNSRHNQIHSENSMFNLQEVFLTATKEDKYFLILSIEMEYLHE